MASGGIAKIHNPWDIEAGELSPITYEYTVPIGAFPEYGQGRHHEHFGNAFSQGNGRHLQEGEGRVRLTTQLTFSKW